MQSMQWLASILKPMNRQVTMKLIAALALSIMSTKAVAKGVAYLDAPIDNGRMQVLLSDVMMDPEDCGFGGKHGYLGQLSSQSIDGRSSKSTGCWRMSDDGKKIIFTGRYDGDKWGRLEFPVSSFTPLQ